MSKRKGLSFEEKRQRLCEIFYESKDFFQLKELEKIAPKTKGIVSQSVKEVLDSLVSDNLVQFDKIGTSNYFWSFPSTALLTVLDTHQKSHHSHQDIRQKKLEELASEVQSFEEAQSDLQARIQAASEGREESHDREEWLKRLEQVQQEYDELEKALQEFADNDPAMLDAKRKATETAKSAVNRWTENVMSLRSYCSDKFNIASDEFDKQFEIPDEFDTIA